MQGEGKVEGKEGRWRQGKGRTKGRLCAILPILLSDLDEHGLVHQFPHILALVVDLVLVPEGRVAGDDYAFGLVVLAKLILLQPNTPTYAQS